MKQPIYAVSRNTVFMIKIIRAYLFFLLPVGIFGTVSAQQISEAEVILQRIFIDGNREMSLGNDESAIDLFEQVLKDDPSNHAAWFKIARLDFKNDRPERALRNIEKALDLAPENAWYLLFKAEVLEKVGKFSKAADCYKGLVALDPDRVEFYHRWAKALIRDEKPMDAIKVYDRLEKTNGTNQDIVRRKHTLYLGVGNRKKAAAELNRLIDAYPSQNEYRYLLAEFYEQIEEPEKARAVYTQILELDPNDPKAKLRLAGSSTRNSDQIEFVRSLEPIFRQADLGLEPKVKRVIPLIQEVASTQDEALAKALLEQMEILKEVHPGEAIPFAASGDLLYHTGRTEEALQAYLASLEFDDTIFSVWEQILTIYASEGKLKELKSGADEAMEIFPNKARLYVWSGMADIQTGQPKSALSSFDQATLMSSGNPASLLEIYYWMGVAYTLTEDWEAAEKAFQDALEIQPNAPLVLSGFSLLLSESGSRPKEALQMAELSLKADPRFPPGLQAKGWHFYKQKKYAEAAKWLNDANAMLKSPNPMLLEQLGDVYFQQGRQEEAINLWEQARLAGSESRLLERKIADRKLYE